MAEPGVSEPVRPTWSLMFYVAGTVLLIVVVRNVFVAASGVLAWALASAVLAVLLAPVVAFVNRAIPRWSAILLVFLAVAAGGLVLRSVYLSEVRDQVEFFADRGPNVAADIEARDDQIGDAARELKLSDRVDELTKRLENNIGSQGDQLRDTALSIPSYVVVFILSIFLMIFGPQTMAGAVNRLSDGRRERIENALQQSADSTQRQVGAAIMFSVTVAGLIWVAGWWMGFPASGLLALFAAAFAIVPYVGVVVGSLPVLVAGLGVAPAWQVGVVAVGVAALQFAEATQWRPRVDRRSLYVGPAVPVIAGGIGYAAYGLGGAVITIIVAVFTMAMADQLATDDDPAGAVDLPTPIDDYVEPA